jgi:hypothetical protein
MFFFHNRAAFPKNEAQPDRWPYPGAGRFAVSQPGGVSFKQMVHDEPFMMQVTSRWNFDFCGYENFYRLLGVWC